MKTNPNLPGQLLRIAVPGFDTDGYNYQFFLDEEKNKNESDVMIDIGHFSVVLDPESAQKLEGATIDWVETMQGSGFRVENPNKPKRNLSDPNAQKIQELLDNEINPGVASHGGFIELIDVKGPRAFIKMHGGCHGCGMSKVTLKQGVETRIKDALPEILEVVDVTDHTSGENPYYNS